MARTTLDDSYRGGRVEPEAESPKPRLRYPCFATGCPAPGTMWPGVTQGTGDKPGTCVYHYGVNPSDIPKVTQVLQDWQCVSFEVNEARRAHSLSEVVSSPKGLQDLFDAAVERLQPQVAAGGWKTEFQPKPGEDYRAWCRRLEAFIGGRVVEVLTTHRRAA